MSEKTEAFAAYIHWPFCASKCPYCDFNAHLAPDDLNDVHWIEAYEREIDQLASRVQKRPLTSIFFGGGTPSLMPAKTVEKVLDKCAKTFGFDAKIEISLEANPGSSDAQKFQDFANAGVNRFSLGVQALDDEALKLLGRTHSSAHALRAIDAATKAVDRVSIDLIYGRPNQNLKDWQAELQRAIDLGTGHLSLYQLTIENGTRFEAMVRRGELEPLDDDTQAAFFEATNELVRANGFSAYEVSNYAKPNQECQHNLLYWRGGNYLGIGPGAHGRVRAHNDPLRKIITRNQRMPQTWLDKVQSEGNALQQWDTMTSDDEFTEALMMGLRVTEGVPWSRLKAIDEPMTNKLKTICKTDLNAFTNEGWLMIDDTVLKLSATGRQRMNSILAKMLDLLDG